MISSEGLTDIVEYPVSEWGDDIYFGDDDDLEDELNLKTNGDLSTRTYSSRPGTNKSNGSQLRADSKRVRLKYSHPPVFNSIVNNLKRDPTIEYTIESRKTNVVENIYTHLAQTISQSFRPSYSATPALRPRFMTTISEIQIHDNNIKDQTRISLNDNKLPIIASSQFDNDKWDDGLHSDFDEDKTSKDKSSLQVYEETCKRLNISICSMIVRSLHTTKINLENYGLGPKGSAALAVALIRNTTVLSLNLSGNNIESAGMSYIYQILTENAYIEEYDLSYNKLGTKGIRKLAAATIYCVQLKSLSVAGNNLTASDIDVLLSKLENHSNLRDLNLSHNQLDEEGGISLAEWLCDNNVLLNLDISWCSIRLMGARALATAIGDNNKLISIDLSHNSFTNETVESFTNSLKRNMVLNNLNLSENQLFCRYNVSIHENPSILITGNESEVYNLFAAAMTNQVLKIFRLGKNHLDTRCVMIILEALSKLDNISLEELDLTGLTITSKQKYDIQTFFSQHRQFHCDVEPIKKTIDQLTNHLLNTIHTYCYENQTNLMDLFTLSEDNLVIMSYEQFQDGLNKAKIPYSIAQIENMMKYLGKDDDEGEISLRSLEVRC